MKSKMKTTTIIVGLWIPLFALGIFSSSAQTDLKSKELINKLSTVTGGYQKLREKKDVQFKYTYDNLDKGKDVSLERLIFDGEHSWASYSLHQRNVLPGQNGLAIQSLIDGKPKLTLNGVPIHDDKAIEGTLFLRRANTFWFTMLYKLSDRGTIFKYMGKENVGGVIYEKVNLTYSSDFTKKKKNDEFILYFNPVTRLIDFFYFSLPAFGIDKPILKMTMKYTVIEGIYIPTERRSYMPNEKGEYQLNGVYTFESIKFDNGFTPNGFNQIN